MDRHAYGDLRRKVKGYHLASCKPANCNFEKQRKRFFEDARLVVIQEKVDGNRVLFVCEDTKLVAVLWAQSGNPLALSAGAMHRLKTECEPMTSTIVAEFFCFKSTSHPPKSPFAEIYGSARRTLDKMNVTEFYDRNLRFAALTSTEGRDALDRIERLHRQFPVVHIDKRRVETYPVDEESGLPNLIVVKPFETCKVKDLEGALNARLAVASAELAEPLEGFVLSGVYAAEGALAWKNKMQLWGGAHQGYNATNVGKMKKVGVVDVTIKGLVVTAGTKGKNGVPGIPATTHAMCIYEGLEYRSIALSDTVAAELNMCFAVQTEAAGRVHFIAHHINRDMAIRFSVLIGHDFDVSNPKHVRPRGVAVPVLTAVRGDDVRPNQWFAQESRFFTGREIALRQKKRAEMSEAIGGLNTVLAGLFDGAEWPVLPKQAPPRKPPTGDMVNRMHNWTRTTQKELDTLQLVEIGPNTNTRKLETCLSQLVDGAEYSRVNNYIPFDPIAASTTKTAQEFVLEVKAFRDAHKLRQAAARAAADAAGSAEADAAATDGAGDGHVLHTPPARKSVKRALSPADGTCTKTGRRRACVCPGCRAAREAAEAAAAAEAEDEAARQAAADAESAAVDAADAAWEAAAEAADAAWEAAAEAAARGCVPHMPPQPTAAESEAEFLELRDRVRAVLARARGTCTKTRRRRACVCPRCRPAAHA